MQLRRVKEDADGDGDHQMHGYEADKTEEAATNGNAQGGVDSEQVSVYADAIDFDVVDTSRKLVNTCLDQSAGLTTVQTFYVPFPENQLIPDRGFGYS